MVSVCTCVIKGCAGEASLWTSADASMYVHVQCTCTCAYILPVCLYMCICIVLINIDNSLPLTSSHSGTGAANCSEASQMQLINHCKAMAEQASSLVQAVKLFMNNPDSLAAMLGLINSSRAMIPVSGWGYSSECGLHNGIIFISCLAIQ